MDNSDNLTKKREERILQKKGKSAGGAKILKIEKRREKIKAIPKKVVGGMKEIAGDVLLAPLLPFKGAMKKELKHKGIDPSGLSFKEIVLNFYNQVISKKNNKNSSYEEVNANEFINNASFSMSFEEVEQDNQAGVAVTAISTIVQAVINLFKQAKERRKAAKEAGLSEAEYKKQSTEEEVRLGEEGEKVQKELEEKAILDGNVKKLDVKKVITYAVIIGVVVLAFYFLNKKK
jgi:hypothetical protein